MLIGRVHEHQGRQRKAERCHVLTILSFASTIRKNASRVLALNQATSRNAKATTSNVAKAIMTAQPRTTTKAKATAIDEEAFKPKKTASRGIAVDKETPKEASSIVEEASEAIDDDLDLQGLPERISTWWGLSKNYVNFHYNFMIITNMSLYIP